MAWCAGAATKNIPRFHHDGGHEEHEVYNTKLSEAFVAFVIFVVRMSFVKCCIDDQ
jgi:hypothetical protein